MPVAGGAIVQGIARPRQTGAVEDAVSVAVPVPCVGARDSLSEVGEAVRICIDEAVRREEVDDRHAVGLP